MNIKGIGWQSVDWFDLTKDRDKDRSVVNEVGNETLLIMKWSELHWLMRKCQLIKDSAHFS